MAAHFVTLPREIRNHIYKHILPDGNLDLAVISPEVRHYFVLQRVNKQIRSEVVDAFHTWVPFRFNIDHLSRVWLWGLKCVIWNSRDKSCVIASDANKGCRRRIIAWSMSKVRNFEIIITSGDYRCQTDFEGDVVAREGAFQGRLRGIKTVLDFLRAAEYIAELHVELVAPFRWDEYDGYELMNPRSWARVLEKAASDMRDYGDYFKAKLTSVKRAKLTARATSWEEDPFQPGDFKLFYKRMGDYRIEWEQAVEEFAG